MSKHKKKHKNKKFHEHLENQKIQKEQIEIKNEIKNNQKFNDGVSYKYIVDKKFNIFIFDSKIGHWQVGTSDFTLSGGFISFLNDELECILKNGSESLCKKSILEFREKEIELFKEKISNGDYVMYKLKSIF